MVAPSVDLVCLVSLEDEPNSMAKAGKITLHAQTSNAEHTREQAGSP
jgi:hypothetical protein